jgi:predicted RNase H-like HicB family nuclease
MIDNMMKTLSAVIHKEGDWFVSLCPELDVASQGKTIEEAIANLKEAVSLYLEDEDVNLPDSEPIITTIEVSYDKAPSTVGS